ncbi:DUF2744 domain-containing protein [Rhodococcus sp. NPDC060176]|uniref:phage gene 29 protein family protein n=1 Tax=Rhodococcus sp. NPDC060176 TaxID=3347062 RepID=UPI0036518BB6
MSDRIPTLENCDQSDPEQVLQWIAVQLPFAGKQEYTPGPDQRAAWSKRWDSLAIVYAPSLVKLADENGNIHVSQLPQPKLKLRVPHRGQQHYLNGAMQWVDIDEPELDPVALPDMGEYTRHEQEFVAEQLRYHGVVKDAAAESDSAEVVDSSELFDPADHTVSGVNGYLLAPIPLSEKRRVIAAEMASKKPRQGILNAPQNRGL